MPCTRCARGRRQALELCPVFPQMWHLWPYFPLSFHRGGVVCPPYLSFALAFFVLFPLPFPLSSRWKNTSTCIGAGPASAPRELPVYTLVVNVDGRQPFTIIVFVRWYVVVYLNAHVKIHRWAGFRDQRRNIQQLGKPFQGHWLILGDVEFPVSELLDEPSLVRLLEHNLHQRATYSMSFRTPKLLSKLSHRLEPGVVRGTLCHGIHWIGNFKHDRTAAKSSAPCVGLRPTNQRRWTAPSGPWCSLRGHIPNNVCLTLFVQAEPRQHTSQPIVEVARSVVGFRRAQLKPEQRHRRMRRTSYGIAAM